jgi:hypothetical protein
MPLKITGLDAQIMAFLMRHGDARCPIPKGARVQRNSYDHTGTEAHRPGHQGTVTGSLLNERPTYLVLFDGDPHETFLQDRKIDKL